jgi:Uma2 family endonuclease
MATQVLQYLFTVEEYHRMAQAGILSEDDRVELIEGKIVEMTPIGSKHAAVVARLTRLFSEQVGRKAIVWVQNPIHLEEHSEPQPDVALLRPREDFYASDHPKPEDVLLVVEVAESSVEYDREIKVPLYAREGIPEVWLVDLESEAIEIYRSPSPEGYIEVQTLHRGAHLSSKSFPDVELLVQEILG